MDFYAKTGMLVLWILIHASVCRADFVPTDNILINCGSESNTTNSGRVFVPDQPSSTLSINTKSGEAQNSTISNEIATGIYSTARIFKQISSYTINIKQQGKHWVRLHFFPLSTASNNLTSSVFSVSTSDFGLLYNFQIKDQNATVMKEYLINIDSNSLVLMFKPANSSLAFINGIEVVSVPDFLTTDSVQYVPLPDTFTGLSSRALERMFRLNVGGPLVTPDNDTLSRYWFDDRSHLDPASAAESVNISVSALHYMSKGSNQEIAPPNVYATAEEMQVGNSNVPSPNFNLSWIFDVDPKFQHFVRMHFCDIVSPALNDLYFNAYINNDIAIRTLDLSSKFNNLAVPYYADFVTKSGISTLRVKVGPATGFQPPYNAILNGLEIMKISNDEMSLDGPFAQTLTKKSRHNVVGAIVGSTIGAVAALGLLAGLYVFCCRRKSRPTLPVTSWLPLPQHGGHSDTILSKGSKFSAGSHGSSAPSNLGKLFTFAEIQEATKSFDESLILGVGGFGKVYKGILEDGTNVAVKRGNQSSEQGMAEFRTEIEMLSKLRHRHLVSLIGFCEERCEMILVYEYMANGPLRSHLYGSELPPLPWKQRLDICIGSARGLHYLHTGADQGIIHRDVKTTNILLDDNFVAKVADFGLSKTGPSLDQTHVSTAVKGSFGYLDPEYFRRQQLTEKSDVYSFGVVLLEVLCARPAINPTLPRDQVNIAEWAMQWQRRGMLDQIIDSRLVGHINPNSLRKFGETAEKCLAEQGIDRPSMGDVLWNLEYALQLQETAMLDDPDENSTNRITDIPSSVTRRDLGNSAIDKSSFVSLEGSESTTTNTVFSQLNNPLGR